MFGPTTEFARGGFVLKHNIMYMSVRAFMLYLCSGLLYLLALTPYPAAAADKESILSTGISATGEAAVQKYVLVKPDLHLLRDDENAQITRLLASSTNENAVDTNDPHKTPPSLNDVSTAVAAPQSSSHDRWPYFLPVWGVDAEKRGHKLPHSIGVTPGFYSGKRHIAVDDPKVYIAGRTIPADRLTRIKVKSKELNWSVRLDAWIFPFLSLYALCGYTRQYTDASIGVNLIDRFRRRRGANSKYFRLSVDLTGTTYGGGITLVGGYKKFFTALDSNYTISALQGDLIFGNKFSPDVRAQLCSIRFGWREKIGESHLNFWIGETYWDTTNEITGNPDIPVVGKVGFSLTESTERPWSTHIGTHLEITQTFQFMVDMGTNFRGLFCIAPAFIYRF
jgi:hypothetical protein